MLKVQSRVWGILSILDDNFKYNWLRKSSNFYGWSLFETTKKNYTTNKTDVYHSDGIWCLEILDFKDYGPEKYRGCRYVLVVIDIFSIFGWTVPSKNKKAQTIRKTSKNVFYSPRENQIWMKQIGEKNFEKIIFKIF